MNKDKLILDAIKEETYRVNRTQRPVYGQGQYDMAYTILDKVQKIIQSETEETCYSSHDCEMKQDDKCTLFGPCPHLHKKESLHDIIYDFITQYSGGISLTIDTQDGELLKDYIKDYLNEKAGE